MSQVGILTDTSGSISMNQYTRINLKRNPMKKDERCPPKLIDGNKMLPLKSGQSRNGHSAPDVAIDKGFSRVASGFVHVTKGRQHDGSL